MEALAFWKAVIADRSDFLESLTALLADHQIRYCVIDGVAVNAYTEPVVTLDLDLVVAGDQLQTLLPLLESRSRVKHLPCSINLSMPGSKLRVQIPTDPCYSDFPARALPREVLDLSLPVAAPEDLLQGRVWAVAQPQRRPSKRQKDLADIARLLEAYPHLRERVPAEVLSRLFD